jgi:hypothetical protein
MPASVPDFLPETKNIREGDWVAAPIPADLQDRRVEITGPVDRKMIINALNSVQRFSWRILKIQQFTILGKQYRRTN